MRSMAIPKRSHHTASRLSPKKAGALLWDAEASVQGLGSVKTDGSDFAFGAGAQLAFGALAIRAEYEQFMIKDIDDLNLVSLGLTWQF